MAVKTPARGIQGVRWCAKPTASTSKRVWYRGDTDVHAQGNMVSTETSATSGNGSML